MQFYDQQYVAKTNVLLIANFLKFCKSFNVFISLMADRDHGLKSFYPDSFSRALLHASFCATHTGSGTLVQQGLSFGLKQTHVPQTIPQHVVPSTHGRHTILRDNKDKRWSKTTKAAKIVYRVSLRVQACSVASRVLNRCMYTHTGHC